MFPLLLLFVTGLQFAVANRSSFKPVYIDKYWWFNGQKRLSFGTKSITACASHARKVNGNLPFSVASGHCEVLDNQGVTRFPVVIPHKAVGTTLIYTTVDRVGPGEEPYVEPTYARPIGGRIRDCPLNGPAHKWDQHIGL